MGTESAADASLFHIIPAGDPKRPSHFHIAYWGRGRQYTTHVHDLYRTHNERGPPLPQYVSTDTDEFGINIGSLSMDTCVDMKQACFSLHCRLQRWFFCWLLCSSTPIDLSSWLEGEQFYIKCSYHSILKVNGYLAIEKAGKHDDGSNCYKVTTAFLVFGKSPAQTGMLFRLHPEGIKRKAEEERKSATTPNTTNTPDTTTTPDTTDTQTSTLAQYLPSVIFGAIAGMLLYVLVNK